MKIYLLVIALIIDILLNSSADGADRNADPEKRMQQLRKEVSADLPGNLLPYWSKNMVDNVNGGFYGRIDGNEKVYQDEDKGGILNARILWTYSSAYRIYKDTAYLRLANRARDYIMAHFIDKEYGGAYRSVNAKGEPSASSLNVDMNWFRDKVTIDVPAGKYRAEWINPVVEKN